MWLRKINNFDLLHGDYVAIYKVFPYFNRTSKLSSVLCLVLIKEYLNAELLIKE